MYLVTCGILAKTNKHKDIIILEHPFCHLSSVLVTKIACVCQSQSALPVFLRDILINSFILARVVTMLGSSMKIPINILFLISYDSFCNPRPEQCVPSFNEDSQ